MRITEEIVIQVQQMLASNELSQRKIARKLGISRGTVNTIAQGRPLRKRPAPPRDEFGEYSLPSGPFVRCPGCGGRVILPCLLCRIREVKRRDRDLRTRARRGEEPAVSHRTHWKSCDPRDMRLKVVRETSGS
jgi:hypothetical protein